MWVVGGLVVIAGLIFFLKGGNPVVPPVDSMTNDQTMNPDNMAMASATIDTNSNIGGTNTNPAESKTPSGYPASWPTDIAKYPNGKVISSASDNLKSKPKEAIAIITTTDSVRTVVNFYLNNLVKNGWKITEDGAGLANQITFRATKGTRTVGGYAEKMATSGTKLTMGVNEGI